MLLRFLHLAVCNWGMALRLWYLRSLPDINRLIRLCSCNAMMRSRIHRTQDYSHIWSYTYRIKRHSFEDITLILIASLGPWSDRISGPLQATLQTPHGVQFSDLYHDLASTIVSNQYRPTMRLYIYCCFVDQWTTDHWIEQVPRSRSSMSRCSSCFRMLTYSAFWSSVYRSMNVLLIRRFIIIVNLTSVNQVDGWL